MNLNWIDYDFQNAKPPETYSQDHHYLVKKGMTPYKYVRMDTSYHTLSEQFTFMLTTDIHDYIA